jgi:hypothetical protein
MWRSRSSPAFVYALHMSEKDFQRLYSVVLSTDCLCLQISSYCLQGDGFGGFVCQHGERECKGNLMQSCALSLLDPSGPQMEFVYCVMSSNDGSQEGKRVRFSCHANQRSVFFLDFSILSLLLCSKLHWIGHETEEFEAEQNLLL